MCLILLPTGPYGRGQFVVQVGVGLHAVEDGPGIQALDLLARALWLGRLNEAGKRFGERPRGKHTGTSSVRGLHPCLLRWHDRGPTGLCREHGHGQPLNDPLRDAVEPSPVGP